MKFRAYEIIAEAVGRGITLGHFRAHKHTDKPEPDAVQEAIHTAVMGALCDILDFEPPGDDGLGALSD